MTEPRDPTSRDEELLEAETLTILSELDDDARIEHRRPRVAGADGAAS